MLSKYLGSVSRQRGCIMRLLFQLAPQSQLWHTDRNPVSKWKRRTVHFPAAELLFLLEGNLVFGRCEKGNAFTCVYFMSSQKEISNMSCPFIFNFLCSFCVFFLLQCWQTTSSPTRGLSGSTSARRRESSLSSLPTSSTVKEATSTAAGIQQLILSSDFFFVIQLLDQVKSHNYEAQTYSLTAGITHS